MSLTDSTIQDPDAKAKLDQLTKIRKNNLFISNLMLYDIPTGYNMTLQMMDRYLLFKSNAKNPQHEANEIKDFIFTKNNCDCAEILSSKSEGIVIVGFRKDIPFNESFVCIIYGSEIAYPWKPKPVPDDGTASGQDDDITPELSAIENALASDKGLIILHSDQSSDTRAIVSIDGLPSAACHCITVLRYSIVDNRDATYGYFNFEIAHQCPRRNAIEFSAKMGVINDVLELGRNYIIRMMLSSDVKCRFPDTKYDEFYMRNIVGMNIPPVEMIKATTAYPEIAKVFGDPESFLIGYLNGDD
jgi:hypothetical protein